MKSVAGAWILLLAMTTAAPAEEAVEWTTLAWSGEPTEVAPDGSFDWVSLDRANLSSPASDPEVLDERVRSRTAARGPVYEALWDRWNELIAWSDRYGLGEGDELFDARTDHFDDDRAGQFERDFESGREF